MNEQSLIEEFLKLSDHLRPGYSASLGPPDPKWKAKLGVSKGSALPSLLSVVYATVSGTRRDIADQSLMDFIPGYYLIHIDETAHAREVLATRKSRVELFPFLANYSSDYICVTGGPKQEIRDVMHDWSGSEVMHKSSELFLCTLCEFYRRAVYVLNTDGYLDCDFEAAGACGAELNPGVKYWRE
jgi:hypothetical protein